VSWYSFDREPWGALVIENEAASSSSAAISAFNVIELRYLAQQCRWRGDFSDPLVIANCELIFGTRIKSVLTLLTARCH
jgi:hypothetical protein